MADIQELKALIVANDPRILQVKFVTSSELPHWVMSIRTKNDGYMQLVVTKECLYQWSTEQTFGIIKGAITEKIDELCPPSEVITIIQDAMLYSSASFSQMLSQQELQYLQQTKQTFKDFMNQPASAYLLEESSKFIEANKGVAPAKNLGEIVPVALREVLPGLDEKVVCPKCGGGKRPLMEIIIHLNDLHKWDYATVADWLESLDIDIEFKEKDNAGR